MSSLLTFSQEEEKAAAIAEKKLRGGPNNDHPLNFNLVNWTFMWQLDVDIRKLKEKEKELIREAEDLKDRILLHEETSCADSMLAAPPDILHELALQADVVSAKLGVKLAQNVLSYHQVALEIGELNCQLFVEKANFRHHTTLVGWSVLYTDALYTTLSKINFEFPGFGIPQAPTNPRDFYCVNFSDAAMPSLMEQQNVLLQSLVFATVLKRWICVKTLSSQSEFHRVLGIIQTSVARCNLPINVDTKLQQISRTIWLQYECPAPKYHVTSTFGSHGGVTAVLMPSGLWRRIPSFDDRV